MPQAYDTAAYKIAADDLLLSRGVDILFHALAVGVVMDATAASRRCWSRPSPAAWRCSARCSSTAPATAISPPLPARASRRRRTHALSEHDVPPEQRRSGRKPAKPGRRCPRLMQEAEARGETFPRKGADPAAAEAHHRMARQRHAGERPPTATRSTAPMRAQLSAGEIDGRRQARAFFDFLKREAPGFSRRLHRRHPAAARHPRDAAHHRAGHAHRRRRHRLRDFADTHRRQRLAAGDARRRRRGLALAGHSRLARLQPPALPHAGATTAAGAPSTTCWSPAAAPR